MRNFSVYVQECCIPPLCIDIKGIKSLPGDNFLDACRQEIQRRYAEKGNETGITWIFKEMDGDEEGHRGCFTSLKAALDD